MRADVSDLADGRRLLDEAMALAGRIDLWVNNAGIAPERRLDLLETTPESWDRVVDTNLRGPFFLSQAVAREMLRLRSAGVVAEPQIVFITSISSRFASISRGEYCVAKAGLSMVAQLFAARLAGEGIRVYEIRPGLIDTDMTRSVRAAYDERIAAGLVPMGRWGNAEDVGRAVAQIAAGAFPYSTGAVIDVDGGLGMRVL
jgi:NAD(P)-dependent dehydrogenase (short-subunit alcohol dehydrogenase family)